MKEERQMMEGSPKNTQRVLKAQFDLSRRRMMEEVARATVVITNPTHFAVAVEYRRDTMPAPRVVAMGADHVALRIRDVARYHGVPVVENKPLAEALLRTAEIGQTIPAPLFGDVAEVLAHLVRVKRLML